MTFERSDGICCSSIIDMYIRAVSSYSLWYLVSEVKVNLFHIWICWNVQIFILVIHLNTMWLWNSRKVFHLIKSSPLLITSLKYFFVATLTGTCDTRLYSEYFSGRIEIPCKILTLPFNSDFILKFWLYHWILTLPSHSG